MIMCFVSEEACVDPYRTQGYAHVTSVGNSQTQDVDAKVKSYTNTTFMTLKVGHTYRCTGYRTFSSSIS